MPQEDPFAAVESNSKAALDSALSEANLAKGLRKKKIKGTDELVLDDIAMKCLDGYRSDLRTLEDWTERQQEFVRQALLFREYKSYPWTNASNVKFPLLATAALQFAARAYPSLVPNDGALVKTRILGKDEDQSREARAKRIAEHMSYQFMYEIPDWEEEFDRACFATAILGTTFKKTYVDTIRGRVMSELVLPYNLIINYNAKSLESAYRKTEIIFHSKNEIMERVLNDEIFLDDILDELEQDSSDQHPLKDAIYDVTEAEGFGSDQANPYLFLVQHTYYDLDGDGYEEPYVIWIHERSGKVVRIVARWDSDGYMTNVEGDVIAIEPIEYFTKFGFISNPQSAIYDLGFGLLLSSLNEAIDSLLNQLIDAGTLSNLQSGFIAKGLRVKMGDQPMKPGEWRSVHGTAEDLKGGIVPLPVKEPSAVLFQLFQALRESGMQLASVAEIFTGKMPGQNTPATTTQETVEQGMKVFTAIYKRFYRALHKEFKKVYRLNRLHPDLVAKAAEVLGGDIFPEDYDGPENEIIPAADPSGDSTATRMLKNQQIGQILLPIGTIDKVKYTTEFLRGLEIPQPETWLPKPQPPQKSPEQMKAEAQIQVMQQKGQQEAQSAQIKMQTETQIADLKKQVAEMQMAFKQRELQYKELELQFKEREHHFNLQAKDAERRMEIEGKQRSMMMDLQSQAAGHQQATRFADESHQQKMRQAAQTPAKPKSKPTGGGKKRPNKR